MDKGLLFAVLSIVSFLIILAAALLAKTLIIDPKRVRESFQRLIFLRGFNLISKSTPEAQELKTLIESYVSRRIPQLVNFNILLKREEKNRTVYLSDMTTSSMAGGRNSSNFCTSLFVRFYTGEEKILCIRQILPIFLEKMLSAMLGADAGLENPIPGFEDNFSVFVASPSARGTVLDGEIQRLLIERIGKYPFNIKNNPTLAVIIAPQGIIITGQRIWEEDRLLELLDFGAKLASVHEKLAEWKGTADEVSGKTEGEDIYKIDV